MTFLHSQRLLAPGSSPLAELQRSCERITTRFVTEMANPANFGLAKGLFAQAGGLEAGEELDEDGLDAVLARMQGLQVDGPDISETMPIRTVGPVTPPDPDERAQSAAAAPALAQLR
ncbi:MAG: hypothetical protein LC799_26420, partial [Actinobacteria bacterium]|nr:hypothetical protein [Actinomycetota bacterium]